MSNYIQFRSQLGDDFQTIFNMDHFCGVDCVPVENEIHLLTTNEDGVVGIGKVIKFDSDSDEKKNDRDFDKAWEKLEKYFNPVEL